VLGYVSRCLFDVASPTKTSLKNDMVDSLIAYSAGTLDRLLPLLPDLLLLGPFAPKPLMNVEPKVFLKFV